MATETLYVNGLASGSVSSPANVNGAPDGVFTTDVDNVSWTARFGMGNPVGNQANGNHLVRLRVRKETGTGTPTITAVRIYDDGVLRVTRTINLGVTSTTGQDVDITLTEEEVRMVTNLAEFQVELSVTGVGGSGGARTTVQLDSIMWQGDFTTAILATNNFFALL